MIVAGDFNLHGHYDADVVNLDLLKTELNIEDACEVLECGDDRIDRIFFRSGPNLELEALAWEIPSNFVDPDGRPLSDHEPIHVKFMLRAHPEVTHGPQARPLELRRYYARSCAR